MIYLKDLSNYFSPLEVCLARSFTLVSFTLLLFKGELVRSKAHPFFEKGVNERVRRVNGGSQHTF